MARAAQRPWLGAGLGGLAVVLALVVVVASRCSSGPPQVQAEPVAASPSRPAPVAAPAPAPTHKPSPMEIVLGIPDARTAAETIRPAMVDDFGKSSVGSDALLAWCMHRPLTWQSVGVARDETSVALVMKDPDAERAKVMCVSGSIVEISAKENEYGKYFDGGIISPRMSIIHFRAVRSTGEIVQHSPARFCGFVTGRYDYANSGGGTSHAVEMVGMFDLPENHVAPDVKR